MGKTEIGSIKIDDLDIIPVSKMDGQHNDRLRWLNY